MNYTDLKKLLSDHQTTLVAVSKTQSNDKIMDLYNLGERVFGENKVQELVEKNEVLPDDIQWHMIGHLQTNKVKFITPFIDMIHSLDRIKLAVEINKHARNQNRTISCLLQLRVASEDSKYGILPEELESFMNEFNSRDLSNLSIKGVMGMATFTEDENQIKSEFEKINQCFHQLKNQYFKDQSDFAIKSYGMSGDFKIAIEVGSNMVRIGSLLFGKRNY